ncbi:MAG TPA: hypothetical protein VLA72_05385, partial [Anaerolineales bacterium]|nr:hypothetical protein [Anaerolineales bacterium]
MPNFKLVSFSPIEAPALAVVGNIERKNDQLSLLFNVTGEIESINLPALTTSPTCKDNLWKATCFEFFVAIKDQSQYWEFNISPSGNWNVYI